jgi:transmembrane sensor
MGLKRATIREQAAWWVTELQDASAQVRVQFAQWLKESPRHIEEFLFFSALWRELDRVDPERCVDIDALVAEAKAAHADAKVTTLEGAGPSVPTPRRRSPWWSMPIATATLATLAMVMWIWVLPLINGANTYTTAIGEQRTVKLADGSLAYLNTQTRIKVRYSEDARAVELIQGEALFSVRSDPRRPFRVHVDSAIVQAVGTEFNVYRRAQGTTVSVVEGVVQIIDRSASGASPTTEETPSTTDAGLDRRAASNENTSSTPRRTTSLRLVAGEQVDLVPGRNVVKQAAPDIDSTIAWRTRRLIFNGQPLATVAAEFNRYNDLQIQVEGDALRARRLIGTFDCDDPEALLRFLEKEDDLVIERDVRVVDIRLRESADARTTS